MRFILTTLFTVACLSFILVFNVIGQNWDMGGYNPALDEPAHEAFMPPAIYTGIRSPAIILEGQDLVLSTAAFGGQISYQWFFNGNPIPEANENILLGLGIQKSNAGIYSLQASNDLGVSELKIELQVISRDQMPANPKEPPKIIYHTGGGRGVIGRPYSLAITVNGERNSYRWYKNGRAIVNATSHRLFFKTLKRTDSGVYRVDVMNKAGRASQKMFLRADRERDDQGGL